MQSKISDLRKFEDLVYVTHASLSLLHWVHLKWAGVLNIATFVRDIQIQLDVCNFVYTEYEVRAVMVLHIFSFCVCCVSMKVLLMSQAYLEGHDWRLRPAQSC